MRINAISASQGYPIRNTSRVVSKTTNSKNTERPLFRTISFEGNPKKKPHLQPLRIQIFQEQSMPKHNVQPPHNSFHDLAFHCLLLFYNYPKRSRRDLIAYNYNSASTLCASTASASQTIFAGTRHRRLAIR